MNNRIKLTYLTNPFEYAARITVKRKSNPSLVIFSLMLMPGPYGQVHRFQPDYEILCLPNDSFIIEYELEPHLT